MLCVAISYQITYLLISIRILAAAADWFLPLARGAAHLRSHLVLHRDIAMQCVSWFEDDNKRVTLKLGDFDISTVLGAAGELCMQLAHWSCCTITVTELTRSALVCLLVVRMCLRTNRDGCVSLARIRRE